jgi:hypothetical protein
MKKITKAKIVSISISVGAIALITTSWIMFNPGISTKIFYSILIIINIIDIIISVMTKQKEVKNGTAITLST